MPPNLPGSKAGHDPHSRTRPARRYPCWFHSAPGHSGCTPRPGTPFHWRCGRLPTLKVSATRWLMPPVPPSPLRGAKDRHPWRKSRAATPSMASPPCKGAPAPAASLWGAPLGGYQVALTRGSGRSFPPQPPVRTGGDRSAFKAPFKAPGATRPRFKGRLEGSAQSEPPPNPPLGGAGRASPVGRLRRVVPCGGSAPRRPAGGAPPPWPLRLVPCPAISLAPLRASLRSVSASLPHVGSNPAAPPSAVRSAGGAGDAPAWAKARAKKKKEKGKRPGASPPTPFPPIHALMVSSVPAASRKIGQGGASRRSVSPPRPASRGADFPGPCLHSRSFKRRGWKGKR